MLINHDYILNNLYNTFVAMKIAKAYIDVEKTFKFRGDYLQSIMHNDEYRSWNSPPSNECGSKMSLKDNKISWYSDTHLWPI